jgi:anti-sigma regulatory factor (Ser/Thr protein kinase)
MQAGDQPGQLVVALEAVLDTRQLHDVRKMLELRLGDLGQAEMWSVITATNELVINALVHGGRCLGLRVYRGHGAVRVEVDDPNPRRVGRSTSLRSGLGIVAGLSRRWGDEAPPRVPPGAVSVDLLLRSRGAAKTVWCEVAV